MDKKKLMLLLGALIIAIGTAMAARSLFAGAGAPQADAATQAPKGPKVLVAQRALPVGTIITADSVAFQLWPKDMVQDAYFIDGEADMNKLLGTVVRYPITAGQPVTQGAWSPRATAASWRRRLALACALLPSRFRSRPGSAASSFRAIMLT